MLGVRGVNMRRPGKMHRVTANGVARRLHEEAFCKVAYDSPASDRCQVLVRLPDGFTYLMGSGRTWPDALRAFEENLPALHEAEAKAAKEAAALNPKEVVP